jgi:AraC family transcriptional regulator
VARKESTEVDHRERIARIALHLEAHLDDPIDVLALARRAAYAKHHFHRVFRGVTGESVIGYVRRLRLERAARRLRRSKSAVARVAIEAGYDSPEAFTRAFVQRFGVAPSAYKGEPASRAIDPNVPAPRVEVRYEEVVNVAAYRHVGGYAGVGETFAAMIAASLRAGIQGTMYGLCPDDPEITPEEHLRFDACTAFEGERALEPPLHAKSIAAGTYAVAVHVGSYATLSETYLALIGRWLPTTRYTLADEPVVEVYIDDPARVEEARRRTEVRVRIDRPADQGRIEI